MGAVCCMSTSPASLLYILSFIKQSMESVGQNRLRKCWCGLYMCHVIQTTEANLAARRHRFQNCVQRTFLWTERKIFKMGGCQGLNPGPCIFQASTLRMSCISSQFCIFYYVHLFIPCVPTHMCHSTHVQVRTTCRSHFSLLPCWAQDQSWALRLGGSTLTFAPFGSPVFLF